MFINISLVRFRHHEMNTSYLWPVKLQEVLQVVAVGFQTFMCTENYCLAKVCWLNTLHS